MLKQDIISIDIAKNTQQVCHITKDGELLLNKAMSRQKTKEYIAKAAPSIVAIEGCTGCHDWGRFSETFSHTVKIINPKKVKGYLEGHKTDKNDALAIANASMQIGLKYSSPKTIEQQSLQSLEGSRRFLKRSLASLGVHIRGSLLGYGIAHPKGEKGLKTAVHQTLELGFDLPVYLLNMISLLWDQYSDLKDKLKQIDKETAALVEQIEPCKRLMKMEGVGISTAVALYVSLGSGDNFKNGRQASAFVGVTPKQHSSGGKVKMIGIDKCGGIKFLRSSLYLGAMSYISRLPVEPKTQKDAWLIETLRRIGFKKTCIALANKTVRTAWSILNNQSEYKSAAIISNQ